MTEMGIDIAVLTKTKLSHDRYTKSFDRYSVVATTADLRKGGVALVYRQASRGFAVESIQCYSKNVIKFALVAATK